MRLTVFFVFIISLNIQAQESKNVVLIDKVELSPSHTLLNPSNTDESIVEEVDYKNIVDHRKSRKHKKHTLHAPMKALTLSELRQLQGHGVENVDALIEENDKVIIGKQKSE